LEGNLRGYKGTRRPGLPLDERVAGLENDVDELRRRQTDDRADLQVRIEEVRTGVENRQAEQESERARQLGRSLRYEELGIFVFVVGVGLSMVGAVG
jgi:hypothetical protein